METSPSTDEPKYTDMYARSLRVRRYLSNYIQGVPCKVLHCKRLTFDILDEAWDHFVQGDDTEFIVPEATLEDLK
jgi:hypothetical protein